MTPRLNALWVGGPLGYLERACLASAIAVGHSVSLYTYRHVTGVPRGIDIRDAREVLPEERMLRHKKTGSFALGSDLFRYELMRRGLGCWIDTDVYFLRPLDFSSDAHIFGWEDENTIATAILQLPQGSAVLADLLAFVNADPVVPPWWPPEEQEQQRVLAAQGRALPLGEMPWGTAGPRALTYFIKKNGMAAQAAPRDVFYPLHWSDAGKIFAPDGNVQQYFTPRTKAVHLWNAMIQRQKMGEIVPSSFVAELCRRHKDFEASALHEPSEGQAKP